MFISHAKNNCIIEEKYVKIERKDIIGKTRYI